MWVAFAFSLFLGTQAELPRYRLEYDVATQAQCPSQAQWTQLFHAKAGYRAIDDKAAGRLRVHVTQQAQSLVATVETCVDGQCFPREFKAARGECASLLETVALATTLHLQMTATRPKPVPLETPKPRSPPSMSLSAPPPKATWAWALVSGISEGPAWDVGLWSALLHKSFSVGLDVRWQAFRQEALEDGLTLRTTSISSGVLPCYDRQPFWACAEAGITLHSFSVGDLPVESPAWHPQAYSGLRLGAFWPVTTTWDIGGMVRAGGRFGQARLFVDETQVYQSSGLYAGLDVVLRWNP